ncbi:MAG TPA: hypothetical protein VIY96_09525 [Thermoanaerobaculia bacterium]
MALVVALALAFASIAEAQTSAGSAEPAGYVAPAVAPAVDRARTVALGKLKSSRCRRLFTDFQDAGGRSLEEVLASQNESAQAHLSRMVFLDGSGVPPCGRPRVFAFTSPGSLSVFVCESFRELTGSAAATAANLVIHEELHSLGAGEAPSAGLPTATQITSSVEWRCGS